MGHGKAGAIGGVALIGLFAARTLDDCGRAGVRAGRAMGEVGSVAGAGRAGTHLDDAARTGAHVVGDGAAEAGIAGRLAAGSAEARGGDAIEGAFGDLAQSGIEFTLDVLELEAGSADAPRPRPSGPRCPGLLDVRVSQRWDEYLGGFGIACAPTIVIGYAADDGLGLRVGDRLAPLEELAEQCRDAGGHCLFVGCPDDACIDAASRSRLVRLVDDLTAYERAIVAAMAGQASAPRWIAVPDARGTRLQVARR